jgi:hypothetical protein
MANNRIVGHKTRPNGDGVNRSLELLARVRLRPIAVASRHHRPIATTHSLLAAHRP